MTPEQILDKYTTIIETEFGYTENQIIQMMKEYAHLMCEKQKEICADNADADYQMITGTIVPDIEVYVLKQSILQCKNATEI